MSKETIESKAFQWAALNSESRRILGMLCLLGALLLSVIARNLAAGEFRLLYWQALVLAVAAAAEVLTLAKVKRALGTQRDVPQGIWLINVFVETGLPTAALFLLIDSRYVNPYQALVAPAVLLYFLFILLSTLRLSSRLSILTGLLSALGYLGATAYVMVKYPRPDAGTSSLPLVYFVYAGLIAAGGLVSAVVARQIRNYVVAALHKTEVQRELEQVNHDLDIARSIQQGLLPRCSPTVRGFDVAGWNQPAEQTGGDYFDWQTLPDGHLAISLGDASGHGIGPALVTASCRAYARASFLAGEEQDGLLDRLNGLLAEDLPANRFITFAVVFLDPDGSQVKVLSAGHGPIMLYRYATGKIENLEAQGIPLGVFAGFKYGLATKEWLAAGDILVLVTDGLYEWENPEGEQFGLARLEEAIRDSRDCPAEALIAKLRSSVVSFCRGTKQQDDVTAVIVKRKAGPVVVDQRFNAESVKFGQPASAAA